MIPRTQSKKEIHCCITPCCMLHIESIYIIKVASKMRFWSVLVAFPRVKTIGESLLWLGLIKLLLPGPPGRELHDWPACPVPCLRRQTGSRRLRNSILLILTKASSVSPNIQSTLRDTLVCTVDAAAEQRPEGIQPLHDLISTFRSMLGKAGKI